MAVTEQQLSPEEKLLKVIQGSGEEKKQPTAEEKLLAAVKPSDGTAPAAVPKPQKVESPPKPVAAKPAPPAAAAPPLAGKPAGAPKAEPGRKPAEPAKAGDAKKEEKKVAEAKAAHPADEKPKLKVVKPDAAPEGKEPPAKTLIGAPVPGVIGAGAQAVIPVKRRSGGKFTVGVVNKGLAAAALVILALTAYEIWATAQAAGMGLPIAGGDRPAVPAPAQASLEELPPLASIVGPFIEKDVFFRGKEIPTENSTNAPAAPQGPLAGRLKLMGFSLDKAILWDTKEARMFVARKGEKILIGEQELELIQVEKDHVLLSDGKESMFIK